MNAAESIKLVMVKRNTNQKALAEKLQTSQGNIGNQLRRNNFTLSQLQTIADALGCEVVLKLRMKDTGEEF